jgi:hypothetical protein
VSPSGAFYSEKGIKKKVGAFILTRGLRHHRYKSFALTGFLAEGKELRAEGISTLSTL